MELLKSLRCHEVLPLPSDTRDAELCEVLRLENEQLRKQMEVQTARIKGLELRNTALQRRVEEVLASWRQVQSKLHTHEVSDIITDYISEFYHNDILRFISKTGDDKKTYSSWVQISEALAAEARRNQNTLKQRCMALAGMTEEEWDAVCLFKRARNCRTHPRRSRNIVQRVMKEIPSGTLKTALEKMFSAMRGIGA